MLVEILLMPLHDRDIMPSRKTKHQADLGFMSVDALITFYRGPELLRSYERMNRQSAILAPPVRQVLNMIPFSFVNKKPIASSLEHMFLQFSSRLILQPISIAFTYHNIFRL